MKDNINGRNSDSFSVWLSKVNGDFSVASGVKTRWTLDVKLLVEYICWIQSKSSVEMIGFYGDISLILLGSGGFEKNLEFPRT